MTALLGAEAAIRFFSNRFQAEFSGIQLHTNDAWLVGVATSTNMLLFHFMFFHRLHEKTKLDKKLNKNPLIATDNKCKMTYKNIENETAIRCMR